MIEIVGVKFNGGKVYYFDPHGMKLENGTMVLVETSRSIEMGKVVIANQMVKKESIVTPLKPIIRIASEDDFKQAAENKEREKEAFETASKKIAEHNLDMKLIGAEYTFDRSKILFYFTADGRVDFRELVKSLASIFRTRIELRQIGVRDEARQLGSIGICGRFLCCSTFLKDFHPVSIKMAKEQGLSLNPTKISGVCGRLMCCLQYEQNAYDDMLSRMPVKGDKVETPDGIGIVADTATLKGRVKVKFVDDNGDMIKMEEYVLGEFNPLDKHKPVRLEKPQEKSDDTEYDEIPTHITESEVKEKAEVTENSENKEQNGNRRDKKKRDRRGGSDKKNRQKEKPVEDGDGKVEDKASGKNHKSGSRRHGGKNRRKEEEKNSVAESKESGDEGRGDSANINNGGYGSGYEI